jgi:predicted Fe-Mo cluster-binding NifX family protein
MKIAAATNDEVNLTGHVGRCLAFIIFEIEDKKIVNKEIRKNNFTNHHSSNNQKHHHGEEHRHGHENLINGLKDCEYLLFQGGGWRLIDDLKANKIKPILTLEKNADEAVIKFLNDELKIEDNLVCNHH